LGCVQSGWMSKQEDKEITGSWIGFWLMIGYNPFALLQEITVCISWKRHVVYFQIHCLFSSLPFERCSHSILCKLFYTSQMTAEMSPVLYYILI
jgi:hypothetical protein